MLNALTGFMAHRQGAVLTSPFEDAVAALSPVGLYLFRDTDFSTQITDSSGNGYHLAKINSTAASRGAQLRGTHPGGLIHPGVSLTNWASQGILYRRAATSGLDVPLGGAGSMSLIIGIRVVANQNSTDSRWFTVGTEGVSQSGTNDIFTVIQNAGVGPNTLWFKYRHSGGGLVPAPDAAVTSSSQVYTYRCHFTSSPERLLDSATKTTDTQKDSAATTSGSAFQNLDRTTFLGGRITTSTGVPTLTHFIVDHISMFIPALTVAQLDTLRLLYQAEIL
jgi:hypothetical protein